MELKGINWAPSNPPSLLGQDSSILEATLDSTADGILVVDLDGNIVLSNERFGHLWRIPEETLLSMDDDRTISFVLDQLKNPETFLKKIEEIYETPNAESFDVLEFNDGRTFERYSRPQKIKNTIMGRVWSFRDITEKVNAENALSEHKQRLLDYESSLRVNAEKAVKNRDLFISIASHELKNPLAALKLRFELLNRSLLKSLDPKSESLMKACCRDIERFSGLIDTMLDVTRINTTGITLQLEVFALDEMVTEVVERYSYELQRAQCPIEVNISEKILGQWDRIRIAQVFTNLLSNAVKFCKCSKVVVTLERENNIAKLKVRDFGPGISKQDQEKMFKPFERLHSSECVQGLGLGLYVSNEIIRAHGGRLILESAPNEGSCFTIELPMSTDQFTLEQIH